MTTGEWIQVATLVVLGVTLFGVFWYAWEARKQAKASTRMAEATLRPVILIWTDDSGAPVERRQEWYIDFRYQNIGNGPAVNIKLYLNPVDGVWQKPPERVGMGVREPTSGPIRVLMNPPLPESGLSVIAEYEDASHTRWQTTLQLEVRDNQILNGRPEVRRI